MVGMVAAGALNTNLKAIKMESDLGSPGEQTVLFHLEAT